VPSYISKLFRDYKGLSPCEYLTKVRIDRAVKLLEDSKDSNVYDIAKIVGFHDPSYFTRLFKNQTGMLPTEYRETRGQK
jgi:two-component system response regulator YesN